MVSVEWGGGQTRGKKSLFQKIASKIGSSHFEKETSYLKIDHLIVSGWATDPEDNHNDDHADNQYDGYPNDNIMKITTNDTARPIRILQFKIYLQSVHWIVLAISTW